MMNKPYRCSDLVAAADGQFPPPPCDDTLGIHIVHCAAGFARADWSADSLLVNGLGVIMGGFISAAADAVMAYAIATLLDDHQTFVSINLQTTFHRPALPGQLSIEARVEKPGRTVAYVVADVHQDGKLVATTVSSVLIRSFG